MNNKVKDLEKVSLGIAVMFGIYWLYSCFIKQYIPVAEAVNTIIGLLILYVLGLGLFIHITGKIPTYKYKRKKISFKVILLCFLLQFTAMWVLTVVMNVSTVLGSGNTSTNINATSLYMLFMLLIFNPIMEEIVFRKLFADKLLTQTSHIKMCLCTLKIQ